MQTLVTNQFASGAPDLVAIENAALAQHQAMATATNAMSTQAIALYSGQHRPASAFATICSWIFCKRLAPCRKAPARP
jgi:hypothetical protein